MKINLLIQHMQKSMKVHNFFKIVWAFVLLIAFLSIAWYQFTGLKAHFFHESAFPLLYAETNIDTGTLFSGRFHGREISPISWPLIGSLLLMLGGKISIGTHSLYAFLFSVFVFFVGLLFCKVAKFSFFTSTLFLIVIFIAFGPIPSQYLWLDQVWIWPMNSYGVYDFFSLACFTIVLKLLQSDQLVFLNNSKGDIKATDFVGITFAALIFFLFSLYGTRGLITIAGNVLFAVAFDSFIKKNPLDRSNLKTWIIILILTVSSVFGMLLIKHLTKGVPQPWHTGHEIVTLNNWSEFRDRLDSIPYTWLTIFNAIPVPGKSIFSIENITRLCNAAFACALIAIPLLRLGKISADKDQAERLASYRFLFILIVISMATIFGTSAWTPRYLLPLAYATLFIFPFYIEAWLKERRYGVIAVVLMLLAPAYITSVNSLTHYSLDEYKQNKFYRFSQFLKSEGLNYGFAGPWTTSVITVNHYSNGQVRIALVDPENNQLQPHPHGDKKWYQPEHHTGLTFIALPESISVSNEKNKALKKQAIKTITFEDWVIDVYPNNIAEELDNKF